MKRSKKVVTVKKEEVSVVELTRLNMLTCQQKYVLR